MLLKICPNNLSFNKRKHHFKFERDDKKWRCYLDVNNLMTGERTGQKHAVWSILKQSKGDNEVDMGNT